MRDPNPVLLDASAASGGHAVFASYRARMKLVENSRLARGALVDDESTTSPFIIAQSITSSPVAIPLAVFLPPQPISQPPNFLGHLFFACE